MNKPIETVSRRRVSYWILIVKYRKSNSPGEKNAAEAATGKSDHLCKSQLVFITFLNLHIIRQYNIIPERSPLPAPTLPLLLLHIIVLSGGCGGYCGTFYCWCCRGPLPSDISWLSHFKRNKRKHNKSTYEEKQEETCTGIAWHQLLSPLSIVLAGLLLCACIKSAVDTVL